MPITGLTPDTIYYVVMSVTSTISTKVSSSIEKSFTTLPGTVECDPASITISPSAFRIKIKKKTSKNIEIKVTGDNGCLSNNVEIMAKITYGGSRIKMITEEAFTDSSGIANFTVKAKKKLGNATILFILPNDGMSKNQKVKVMNNVNRKKNHKKRKKNK